MNRQGLDQAHLRFVDGPLDGLEGWIGRGRARNRVWMRPDRFYFKHSTGWELHFEPPGEPYRLERIEAGTRVYYYGEPEESLTTDERERELVPA